MHLNRLEMDFALSRLLVFIMQFSRVKLLLVLFHIALRGYLILFKLDDIVLLLKVLMLDSLIILLIGCRQIHFNIREHSKLLLVTILNIKMNTCR